MGVSIYTHVHTYTYTYICIILRAWNLCNKHSKILANLKYLEIHLEILFSRMKKC